jgi:hypothetical protein
MTELDLLNLARSCTSNTTADFAQVITINFAMVVAIYYFLNEAKIGLKIFAFFVYLIGMLMYVGVMLVESNLKFATLEALRAVPHPSAVAARYVALNGSWLATTTSVFGNVALWVMVLSTLYLLFFWNKASHLARR